MTIASEIQRIKNNISDAYTSCQSKGATMPATQNSDNLANCIDSISGGGGSTLITKTITQNGTYNASSDNADGYSSVTVNVSSSGGVGIPREVSANGVYQMPATSFTFSLPSNATDIGTYAMSYAFQNCTGLTSIDFSSLTTISGNYGMSYAFQNCTGLTSIDFSSLTTISGNYGMNNAFPNCTGLTSIDFSSLTTISGYLSMGNAFYRCTGLTSIDFSNLTTLSGNAAMSYAFYNCTGLTSLDLSNLTTISGSDALANAFNNCTGLTSVLFTNLETIGANTSSGGNSHFKSCFNNCTNLTSITFPNLEKIYCTGRAAGYGTFASNNKVQKMYFPKLDTITYGTFASNTDQTAAKNIFYNCSSLTELHFGAANETAIKSSAGWSTAWGRGAGNVTIYFDL